MRGMEAIDHFGTAGAGRRILLLHPDPERFARVPMPEGWELCGISRPDAVSVSDGIGERDQGSLLWLVHEAFADFVRPIGPAMLLSQDSVADVRRALPAPYLGRLTVLDLINGLLPALLPQVMARWRAESDLARSREQLDFHRWHDPGTALPNPLLFREHLQRLVVRARRLQIDLALIQIDLLGLRHGVPSVQQLRAIAAALRRAGGVANPAGRGDACDFQLVISDLPRGPLAKRRLAAIMDRTVQLLRDAWPGYGGRARMGVAQLGCEIADAVLLEQAAMNGRREAWRRGSAWVDADGLDRGALAFRADALLVQLTECLLVPIVQPVVSLADSRAVSAEVLLRSWGANGRLVPPACPLHALDDLDLLRSVGRTVRSRAIGWLASEARCPRLAVNIAPSELEPRLVGELARVPRDLRQRLTLELTEGALDGRPGQLQVIERLDRLGLALSIDDFGTGHAALDRLRGSHFRQLKLDRCFVSEIVGSAVDQAIAAGVLELGQRLGVGVIAEGVETEGQRRALQRLGYRWAQGYLFGRPMPWQLFVARHLAAPALPAVADPARGAK
jgi:EAL domain-containing protein (putative c-di-GMP-specific phosphodiesterase class I)